MLTKLGQRGYSVGEAPNGFGRNNTESETETDSDPDSDDVTGR